MPAEPKKKRGGVWIPPKEDRGVYRQAKRFPHEVRMDDRLAVSGSLFVRPDIRAWLTAEVGEGLFGWVLCEGFVAFRFKQEVDAERFQAEFAKAA